ncbi:hypothetical protein Micbo1qcDRAFT_173844 [Microdochium bolleyi]|uniref:Uncharacterized protein n=1 Tax=Microdochium bolleyi TaxID=196109 RepID=A0A136J6D2_9PEZI|nr:hypothetical protein Micbo1qcDRAFT_173844 [Microdochium bolleyi]
MTPFVPGPSLPQARDNTNTAQPAGDRDADSHNHDLDHFIHSHPRNGHHSRSSSPANDKLDHHHHHHGRFHNHHRHLHNHARSDHGRARPRANSETVVIIETISVIHIIDAAGSTIAYSTLPPSKPHTTTLVNNPALSTGAGGSLILGLPTGTGNGADTPLPPQTIPTVIPSGSSMPTTFPSLSYAPPVTSTPSSGGPLFPSFGSVTNSTASAIAPLLPSTNSTGSPDAFANSTATLPAVLTSSPLATGSTTISFSVISSTRSPSVTGTSTSSDGGSILPTAGGFTGGDSNPPVANPASPAPSGSSSPPAATVAGGVIGGLAGLAMLLFLAFALLRWRRRRTQQVLEGGAARGGVGALSASRSGPAGGGGSTMSERPRSTPFAVPAALAALTGMRKSTPRPETPPSTAGTGAGERGFSKISGRKLPPVIQFGGDGYSDPRDTIITTDSGDVSYRDSAGMFANNPNQKFAVGTPMRPESGIPVFHDGPSRSPMIDQGPFSDTGPYVRSDSPSQLTPPRPPGSRQHLDPLGRSHASADGSNRSTLSVSRFTENL